MHERVVDIVARLEPDQAQKVFELAAAFNDARWKLLCLQAMDSHEDVTDERQNNSIQQAISEAAKAPGQRRIRLIASDLYALGLPNLGNGLLAIRVQFDQLIDYFGRMKLAPWRGCVADLAIEAIDKTSVDQLERVAQLYQATWIVCKPRAQVATLPELSDVLQLAENHERYPHRLAGPLLGYYAICRARGVPPRAAEAATAQKLRRSLMEVIRLEPAFNCPGTWEAPQGRAWSLADALEGSLSILDKDPVTGRSFDLGLFRVCCTDLLARMEYAASAELLQSKVRQSLLPSVVGVGAWGKSGR